MKKVMLTLAAFLVINAGTGFSSPVNDMEQGQMSIGIVGGNTTNCYYFENRISNNVTLGIQSIDDDTDFYGQIDLSNGFNSGGTPRLIIGNRDLDHGGSTTYVGAGLTFPLTQGMSGYTSLISGSKLDEFQLGAISRISDSVSLNFNYRNVRHRGTKDGFGIGLDCHI